MSAAKVKFQGFPMIWDTEIKDLADSVSIETNEICPWYEGAALNASREKIFFRNRKFYRGNFENVPEITVMAKIYCYNRKSYRN